MGKLVKRLLPEKNRCLIFDVDGVLTLSKQSLDENMAAALKPMFDRYIIAFISGCSWQQMQTQILPHLKLPIRSELYLLPCSGAACYKINGLRLIHLTQSLWNEELTIQEKMEIMQAISASMPKNYVGNAVGQVIEDRNSQVTISACGQQASLQAKEEWNAQNAPQREVFARKLQQVLPEFDVKCGGLTSIDITRKGLHKGYGVSKLLELLKLQKESVEYFGDNLQEGGNDYPVRATGVKCWDITGGPNQTQLILPNF